jgi:hypothetical protein
MHKVLEPLTTDTADDDIVDPFPVLAERAHFSVSTLNRIVKTAAGPPVVYLSKRRKGVRRRDWRAWLASRTRQPDPHDGQRESPCVSRSSAPHHHTSKD